MAKHRNADAEQHLNDVSALGCVVCRNLGYLKSHDHAPAEIHHITTGAGMGQKASDYESIPLCEKHHRTGGWGISVHAGEREFEERYGSQTELLKQTYNDLENYRAIIVGR